MSLRDRLPNGKIPARPQQEAKATYRSQAAALSETYRSEVSSLKQGFDRDSGSRADYRAQLGELRANYKSQLADLRSGLKPQPEKPFEGAEVASADAFVATGRAMASYAASPEPFALPSSGNTSTRSQLQEARSNYRSQVADLREDYQAQIATLRQDMGRDSASRAEYRAQLGDLNAGHRAKLAELEAGYKSTILSLKGKSGQPPVEPVAPAESDALSSTDEARAAASPSVLALSEESLAAGTDPSQASTTRSISTPEGSTANITELPGASDMLANLVNDGISSHESNNFHMATSQVTDNFNLPGDLVTGNMYEISLKHPEGKPVTLPLIFSSEEGETDIGFGTNYVTISIAAGEPLDALLGEVPVLENTVLHGSEESLLVTMATPAQVAPVAVEVAVTTETQVVFDTQASTAEEDFARLLATTTM